MERTFAFCQIGSFLAIRTLDVSQPSEFFINQKEAQKILAEASENFTDEQIQALDALAEKFKQYLAEEDEKQ